MSQAEHALYGALRQAMEEKYLIFAKVRLVDLLWLPEQMPDRQRFLHRVLSKHVDFVLCDRDTVAPLLVVELDDPTHHRPDRQSRDAFVDDVLAAAELPILRVSIRPVYSAAGLATEIENALSQPDPESRK